MTESSTDPRSLTNFGPKVACSDVTKSAMPKKFPIDLKKITDDVTLLYEKACKVSRRYRCSFLSYREYSVRGGGGVKRHSDQARINASPIPIGPAIQTLFAKTLNHLAPFGTRYLAPWHGATRDPQRILSWAA